MNIVPLLSDLSINGRLRIMLGPEGSSTSTLAYFGSLSKLKLDSKFGHSVKIMKS